MWRKGVDLVGSCNCHMELLNPKVPWHSKALTVPENAPSSTHYSDTEEKGTFSPPSSTPIEFCRNGGTWENGRCICTEEWKGLRCTIANFCENSTYMSFTFSRIPVGRYGPSLQTCDKNTVNAGSPIAIRLCSLSIYGETELQNVIIGGCDENLETLKMQIDNISTISVNISTEAQILTSDASKLTPENITSATKVVGQIFNISRNADSEAKKVAVTTVSQLLDASENVFQRAAATDNDDSFGTLIEQVETYSLSLGNDSIVEPNIAIQSVSLENTMTATSILFSVQKGASDSLAPGLTSVETNVDKLHPDGQTELQILVNTNTSNTKKCGFVLYQKNKLFQSKIFTTRSNFSQKIISSKVDGNEQDQSINVKMVFSPKTFKKNYQYPESLDILSNVGCVLSIAGLALTIIFQIVTRKVRKTSVTWVLVNLCTPMLIFNLLFVFGIENSNKNLKTSDHDFNNIDFDNNVVPTRDTTDIPNYLCTVTAAFLHYFLLVTFTWNGLSSIQLYFLLIRTMKPFPQHFILFITLVGWGVPAIIVGVTTGLVYSQNGSDSQWELDYRQEEFCWLKTSDSNGFITSSFLWSFIMPITVILISNIVIFIIITVKVLWQNNQNLTSTKKNSTLKKIFSTLSIAVIFGITWILAYFMLISNDEIRHVFSYIFCLLNTTQGLQLFLLYTIRTKIFQSEASKVFKSLFSSVGKVKSRLCWTSLRLRLRMYNMLKSFPVLHEHFRLLEPSATTEEM
ncbi:Putative G-protein coupled receptor 128 [Fukomys damarensis]|uniref:Putative G-protein coupled receptor 128 n=1 Tax=Fukomys damarensis TaxID=885580 RepID=A0A091D6G9_FUKDA|nr:Putative G-protein coupled receptor 128 [Fukomys damarensis]